MPSDNTRRIFARIFDSEKFGQILVQADQNDDGDPCITIKCDTHPEYLNPTQVVLSFGEDTDQFAKLAEFTAEQAEAFAAGIYKQADHFTGQSGS